MHGLHLYVRYAAVSIRSQLQYRAAMSIATIGVFLVTASELFAIWALFHRFGQVRGWTLPEIALFYGLVMTSWPLSQAIGRGFDVFTLMVKDGGFDRLLVRPRSTVLQLLGQELTLRRVGQLIQGLAVFGYACTAGSIDWSPAKVALAIGAIACCICTFLGVLVVQATSAFWTIEGLEVWSAFTHGGMTMSQYPLAIYRGWFRNFYIYVLPLGCVLYFPGLVILGHADPLGTPAWLGWIAPLAGPVFLRLCLQVWKIGVAHYQSTGS